PALRLRSCRVCNLIKDHAFEQVKFFAAAAVGGWYDPGESLLSLESLAEPHGRAAQPTGKLAGMARGCFIPRIKVIADINQGIGHLDMLPDRHHINIVIASGSARVLAVEHQTGDAPAQPEA